MQNDERLFTIYIERKQIVLWTRSARKIVRTIQTQINTHSHTCTHSSSKTARLHVLIHCEFLFLEWIELALRFAPYPQSVQYMPSSPSIWLDKFVRSLIRARSSHTMFTKKQRVHNEVGAVCTLFGKNHMKFIPVAYTCIGPSLRFTYIDASEIICSVHVNTCAIWGFTFVFRECTVEGKIVNTSTCFYSRD